MNSISLKMQIRSLLQNQFESKKASSFLCLLRTSPVRTTKTEDFKVPILILKAHPKVVIMGISGRENISLKTKEEVTLTINKAARLTSEGIIASIKLISLEAV
jgi:hypothetical protein